MIEESQRLGVDSVVASKRGSALERYCRDSGVRHHPVAFRTELDLLTAARVTRLCRREQIDIVDAHTGPAHSIAVWAKMMGNAAYLVVHKRVASSIRSNPLSRFKHNYKGVDAFVCISEHIAEILRAQLNQPQKCATIHDGIALERFAGKHVPGKLRRELGIADGTALVGNVSAVSNEKDYVTFVDTARILIDRNANAHFAIIGDGPAYPSIASYVRERGLQHHVVMTGQRDDIPEILPDLDVFLMTSAKEGLGTTLLDAFAAEVPVVATRAGGIPEIVADGETGLLADIRSPTQLATQVERYIRDPTLAAGVSSRARALLETAFTTEIMARDTVQLYRRLRAAR